MKIIRIKTLLLSLFLAAPTVLFAQKKALTWDDVIKWNRVTERKLSDDGKHVAVVTSPWRGDAVLRVYDQKGTLLKDIGCAKQVEFLNNNELSFVITPTLSTLDSLERAKNKKKASQVLASYYIKEDALQLMDTVVSFKRSSEYASVAYKKKEGKEEVLMVRTAKKQVRFENVKDYAFSEKSPQMIYSSDTVPYKVVRVDLKTLQAEDVYTAENPIKKIVIADEKHANIAFITAEKDDKKGTSNRLFMHKDGLTTEISLADNTPADWIFNEHGSLFFSKSGNRLIFATSPRYTEKDTLTLASRKAVLDVWHWKEPVLHSEQLVNLPRDKKKSYAAIYFADKNLSHQLANEAMPTVTIPNKAEAPYAYANTSQPYMIERMWEGSVRSDLYTIDLLSTFETKKVFEAKNAIVQASPKGNYLYWYNKSDSSWYSHNVAQMKTAMMAGPEDFVTYDHLNDTPSLPYPQGRLLWNDTETSVLAEGRYDLWRLDPQGVRKPIDATRIGKKTFLKFKALLMEKDQKSFSDKETLLLSVFDEQTKLSGFASFDVKRSKTTLLLLDAAHYGMPIKSEDADVLMLTKESFEDAPDLHLYSPKMKHLARITDINPQQKVFNWGTSELVQWISLRGDTLQGLLYKPADFDPKRKYPLICNFYERSSSELFRYKTPEPHRSTIDYHYYTSNGYLIFNPDIKYYDGEPGQCCYDALMPGIDKVVSMGFVDEKCIGAQGHSWGGYQVAHLSTVTDRFAAIESGAPLVNMLSAYGGLRGATGLNRAFQYEKGQSRIGASIWQAPEKYLANSPLMKMDKVSTPILIMHNDADGHVPWHLGVEFFIALRRLQKPAWLLNYNGEPHWPLKLPNMIDFQTRMSQFFDHYLKGKPMPQWMEEGIPAVEKL